LGSSTQLTPNTHDTTFTFKKSVFFFKDYIVALGSNISNSSSEDNTVTTLYQRLSSENNNVIVNGSTLNTFGTTQLTENSNNWIIDNFGTGFFIVNDTNNSIVVKREMQQCPYWNQYDYTLASTNTPVDYSIAYIDHGSSPKNAGYEYVVKPLSSTTDMEHFTSLMNSITDRPYRVYSKDEKAHIVEDIANKTVGYALFEQNTNLDDEDNLLVMSNTLPCIIMYQIKAEDVVTLSIANPSLSFTPYSFNVSETKQIEIKIKQDWTLEKEYDNVQLQQNNDTTTTLIFNLKDGLPAEVVLHKIHTTQPSFLLTIGSINGIVTKSPDKTEYTEDEAVTLTATPSDGYKFDRWSGDTSGTDSVITVTMNTNKNIEALFTQVSATKIEQQNVLNSFSVFPNPSDGKFTISFSSNYTGEVNVQIISANGSIVKAKKLIKSDELFVSDMEITPQQLGIYIVKVTAGEYKLQQKITIK
jgi:flagellar assembly factor FliW